MSISRFGGSVHISPDGIITLDAFDADNRHGLFQLDVDLNGFTPTITQEHTPLLDGDTLSDQRTVHKFTSHDVNESGNIAAVIHADGSKVEQHYGAGLYLHDRTSGFTPVLICGDAMHDGTSEANGIMGDVALGPDNDIIAVVSHTPKTMGASSGQSLMHLPGASTASASTLHTTGHFISGTDHTLSGFGIVDFNSNGDFGVNSHAMPSSEEFGATENSSGDSFHVLLSGHVSAPNDHDLFIAPPSAAVSPTHSGELSFGPRVCESGNVHTKIAGVDGNTEILVSGSTVIRRTDEPMPANQKILSFTPGSLGSDGTFYYTQYVKASDDVVEVSLMAYNGSEHRLVLTTDNVLTDGGPAVSNIIFSTTTNHIDPDSRIVLLCEFVDMTTSLVIGIPA